MAYTTQQLVDLYTNANLGKGPDQALTLTLDAYATQTQVGGLSDDAALAATLKWVNGTTAVAIETYQFFTGKAPSADGLAYLVNSTVNTNDLNDSYYAKFSAENRFINFAVNLGVFGDGAAAFAAAYGGDSVSYSQVVASAYDKIIGNATATAAGVDVAATVAFFSRQANIDYLKAFVKANGITDPAQADLAVKAALIGEILNAANVSGLGAYSAATTAMIKDLSDGALTNTASESIFITYPAGPAIGEQKNLSTAIDNIVGTSASDTYTGVIDTTLGSTQNTLNPLDVIGGGAGQDTLNINAVTALGAGSLSGVTITGIETINVRGASNVTVDSTNWTDVTALNVKQGAVVNASGAATTAISVSGATDTITVNGGSTVTVSDSTADKTITIGGATAAKGAIAVTDANQGTGNISINGGTDVSVTASKAGAGAVVIGGTTAPTGAVIVNSTGAAYDSSAALSLGVIQVAGGTSVVVNQTANATQGDALEATNAGNETTLSAVTVVGGAKTTSVTVNQSAPVEAVNGVAAVAAVREVDTVTFTGLTAGQTATVNGLSFTAAKTLTAAQVAAAFAGLANNATHGSSAASNGTYSGTFNTIGGATSAASGATVAFTQSASAAGAGTVTVGGTGTSVAVTGPVGSAATLAVEGVAGVIGNTVTVSGAALATVSLSGYGAGSDLTSNVLTSLKLAHSNDDVTVHNTAATTLALGLDSVGTDLGSGVDTGEVDLGGTYATVNVTVTGDSAVELTAGGLKALTVAGTAALDLTGSTIAALETVTVSGSAGLTVDASGSTVKSVDASATSGDNVITVDASKATYKGGTGSDSVTLSSTTISKAVTLGAGDDKLTLASGTAASSVVLDAGDGTDTLAATAQDAAALSATASFGAKITGFEKLEVTDTVAAGVTRAVDLSNLTNINYVVSANGATTSTAEKFTVTFSGAAVGADTVTFDGVTATLANADDATATALKFFTAYQAALPANTHWTVVNNGTSLTFTNKVAGAVTDVDGTTFVVGDVGGAGAPGASFNTDTQGLANGGLTINKFGANGTLELNTAGAGVAATLADATGTTDVFNIVLKNAATTNFGTVSIAGVETVNVSVTDTDLVSSPTPGTMSLGLTDSALKTLVVTGNAGFTLTNTVASLTSIDGSALTRGLTAEVTANSATITGGAGNDVLTASGNSSTLLGGTGNDTLIAKGDLDVLTGGAGNDTFDVSDATTNVNSYATITDLGAGDFIKFKDIAGATVETFTAAKLALGNTAVFQDYANQAISSTSQGAISWFTYGGDTYVVEHVQAGGTTFLNNTDIVVKITGTNVDLSTASLSATGTGTVTLGIH